MQSASSPHLRPVPEPDLLPSLRASIEAVFLGKSDLVLDVLTAVLAGGHVLLEDVPGVGKTTLAQAVAQALGLSFSRIQFTADLLPSDVLGVSIFDEGRQSFRFHHGPIFAQLVLADEINRTPPRTQSSLLEAMNEAQVTVDGELHRLPAPFVVIATQNPLEHHGTFPLPESQLDRFLVRLSVGYPDRESERALLRKRVQVSEPAAQVLDPERLRALQESAMGTEIHPEVEDYLLALLEATRVHPGLSLGASPRAGQSLARASRARAFLRGRAYVTPDDVQELARPVLGHRLLASWSTAGRSEADPERAREILDEILATVPAPR